MLSRLAKIGNQNPTMDDYRSSLRRVRIVFGWDAKPSTTFLPLMRLNVGNHKVSWLASRSLTLRRSAVVSLCRIYCNFKILIFDSPSLFCPFSVHRIVLTGNEFDKDVGNDSD